MLRPTITDYIGTLENPMGVFRTLGEPVVERDVYGEPQITAGNSAAIFTYTNGNTTCKSNKTGRGLRFLKCYIRPNPHLRAVYDYVERRRPALLPRMRLLPDELFVHLSGGGAGWADVVEGEWILGETLDKAVARAARAGDAVRLRQLADAFDALCGELMAAEWAHGDLKPENIIVRDEARSAPGGIAEPCVPRSVPAVHNSARYPLFSSFFSDTATSPTCPLPTLPALSLIDCDAMWIPSLAGRRAAESGTPAYRHPGRTAAHFDKRIDDYPALLISVSLRALALAPELYAKYNTPDALLLWPPEVVAGTSAALAEISGLFAHDAPTLRKIRSLTSLRSF